MITDCANLKPNNKAMTERNRVPIRPYKFKELAAIFQVSESTFRRWLARCRDEIGPLVGHYYSIPQVQIIFRIYGWPYEQVKHTHK